MRQTGIYLLTNTVSGRVYVGQSVDIDRRWLSHKKAARGGVKTKLYNAMRAYGVDAFVLSVLELCPVDSLAERESHWIAQFNALRDGYNMIADTAQARELSPETRRRMSEAQRGKKQSPETVAKRVAKRIGVPLSAEHKAALRDAHQGRVFSDETIERMRAASARRDLSHLVEFRFKAGHIVSEESRARMSAAGRGKPKSPEHRAKLAVALAKARAARRFHTQQGF